MTNEAKSTARRGPRERKIRQKWQWAKEWEVELWSRARRDRARWFSPWLDGGANTTAIGLSNRFKIPFTRKMILGKFDRMRRNWRQNGMKALPFELKSSQGAGGDAPAGTEIQPIEES
jgi:hypothetical protein